MRTSIIVTAGAVFALTACGGSSTPPPAPVSTPLAGVYAANVDDIHGLGPARVRVSMYEADGKITGVFIVHPRPGSSLGPRVFANRVAVSSIRHNSDATSLSGSVDLGGTLGTMTFSGAETHNTVTLGYKDAAGAGVFVLPLVSGYHPVYAATSSLMAAGRVPMGSGGPPPITAPGTYVISASSIPVWTSPTISSASTSYSPTVTTVPGACGLPSPNGSAQFTVALSNPQPITSVGPWPYFPQYTYTGAMSGTWQYGSNQAWTVPNSTSSYVEPQDWDGDFMMTAEAYVPYAISQPSYQSIYNGWQYTFTPVTNQLSGYYVNIQIDTDQGGITGQVQTIPGINLTGSPSVQIGLLPTSWFAGNSPTVTGVCTTSGNITVTGPQ